LNKAYKRGFPSQNNYKENMYMARELHSLNETEMGMVNEYVEAGIASSHEEALKFLLESGMIQDRVGGGGTYIPEGYTYLKFHNGHQKSKFTQVDKLAKKAKKDSPFEVENWYLGAEFPKDDSGNIILDSVVRGEELGQNPNLVITHILCGKIGQLSDEEISVLDACMERLRKSEPIQYILEQEEFGGRVFKVAPGILIPRPETYELCKEIIKEYNRPYCALQPPEPINVLDIGTGSGCIAITLALDLWNSNVTAWDISSDALIIARENTSPGYWSGCSFVSCRQRISGFSCASHSGKPLDTAARSPFTL
jgi:hypothetical protein